MERSESSVVRESLARMDVRGSTPLSSAIQKPGVRRIRRPVGMDQERDEDDVTSVAEVTHAMDPKDSKGSGCVISVSNLNGDITNRDIYYVFHRFGPLKRWVVVHDQSKSTGQAQVVFEKEDDAMEAKLNLDGIALDDRPMHIRMGSCLGAEVVLEEKPEKISESRMVDLDKDLDSIIRRADSMRRGKGLDERRDTMTKQELDDELDRYRLAAESLRGQKVRGEEAKVAVTAEDLDRDLEEYFGRAPPRNPRVHKVSTEVVGKSVTADDLDRDLDDYFGRREQTRSEISRALDKELDGL